MSARMNINLTGTTFTDYHLADVGASAFGLAHDWFTRQDLVIRTAAAGGGTLLVEGTDYTLATESLDLSERVSTAVGSGRNVFREIAIINAAYQSGDLYFSGKYIADSVEAIDHEARLVIAKTGANYTILDDDDIGVLEVDPSGADRTVTLPTVADNAHRELTIVNSAAVNTTYKVIVEGEGAELINQVTTWWVFPGQSITLKSNGTIWRKIAGHVPELHVQDQKAANTNGGTFTSGAWQVRDLNTIVNGGGLGEIAGASLAANQITLPPGLYEIEASAPGMQVANHQAKLTTSAPADLLIGTCEYSNNGTPSKSRSLVRGPLALAAQTVIELRHRCQTTVANTGFGVLTNWAVICVYADVLIRKVV